MQENKTFWDNVIKPSLKNKYHDKCAICEKKYKRMEVHHKKYNDINIDDLVYLCHGCHKACHFTNFETLNLIKNEIKNNLKNVDISKKYKLQVNRILRFRKRLNRLSNS